MPIGESTLCVDSALFWVVKLLVPSISIELDFLCISTKNILECFASVQQENEIAALLVAHFQTIDNGTVKDDFDGMVELMPRNPFCLFS